MHQFIFDIPTRVYFGEGQLHHLGTEIAKFGKRVLLCYGGGSIKKTGLYDKVMTELLSHELEVYELPGIEPNPRITSVRAGAAICKDKKIDCVLAVGGGSTIDAAKFIAAGACEDFDPWEFFSDKKRRVTKALPIVTILTIAATGSEMDPIGVISNMDTGDKLAASGALLTPRVSFLDPTLTYTVPAYQTAAGAADILSHIMETYFTLTPDLYMLDSIMEALMKTVIKYAPVALKQPDNYEARANLMWASSWAINGFIAGARPKRWSCHPMEHELSALYDITHGHGLAIITPRWLEYCLNEHTIDKYVQFGVNVFGIDSKLPKTEIALEAISLLKRFLYSDLGLSSTFASVGIRRKDISKMAAKACRGSIINGFQPLDADAIEKIFLACAPAAE